MIRAEYWNSEAEATQTAMVENEYQRAVVTLLDRIAGALEHANRLTSNDPSRI